jgi:hypothetical protein
MDKMSVPGETDYSKGSFPRTWNSKTFGENFDAIDWSKPEWPDFIGAGFEPEFQVPQQVELEKPEPETNKN